MPSRLHAPHIEDWPGDKLSLPIRLPIEDGSILTGRITACGHLYPEMITTDDESLVTCRSCKRQLEKKKESHA